MHFLIALLRLLALSIAIIGAFTCVIIVGMLLLSLAKDIAVFADKLQDKLENHPLF
jgi:uncharacterized SAM-binding protein YcdF (DUF218 family)